MVDDLGVGPGSQTGPESLAEDLPRERTLVGENGHDDAARYGEVALIEPELGMAAGAPEEKRA